MAKKKTTEYVQNSKLTAEVVIYCNQYAEYKKAKELDPGVRPPQPSPYIGECILRIAKGLAGKPNFVGYRYIEDMEMEGVLAVCRYLHNFNPAKSSNAFSYITTICFHAFVQKIKNEQSHEEGVREMRESMEAADPFRRRSSNGDSDYNPDETPERATAERMTHRAAKKKKPKAGAPVKTEVIPEHPFASMIVSNPVIEEPVNEVTNSQ